MSVGMNIASSPRIIAGPAPVVADSRPGVAATVAAVVARPEDELDYARAKLAFDAIVDPSLDTTAAMTELDRLTEAARQLAGPARMPARSSGASKTELRGRPVERSPAIRL